MHKRLGGTNDNFNDAMQAPNSPVRQSNFGLPPTINVKRAIIDSIIVVNDSSVMVVTSHQIVSEFQWFDHEYDSVKRIFVAKDRMLELSLTYDSLGVWQPGRDLMVNHAVFNPKMKCAEILDVLRGQYHLHSSTENVIFIGFDCSKAQQRSREKRGESFWFYLPKPQSPNDFFLLALACSLIYFFILRIKAATKFRIA